MSSPDPREDTYSKDACPEDIATFNRLHEELLAAAVVLDDLEPAVTIFGSARTKPHDAEYALARAIGHGLGLANVPVITGGGPGIMEAANRGASEAKGINIGLTISIPAEEFDNPYISRELNLLFHYFFMRKFWFTYPAKAVIQFPGGFGTMDELFEILTLIQTQKIKKRVPIVLFGTDFWDRVVDFDALVEFGTISAGDLDLFYRTDSVDAAYDYITAELTAHGLDTPGVQL